jgi:hypothetical protein
MTPLRLAAFAAALLLPMAALPQEKPQDKPKDSTKQDEQEALRKKAQEFKKEVTQTRGVKFSADVKVGVYTKDELLAFLRKEMEREAPREKVEGWAKGYKHFGLIPAELDLYEAFLDLYSSSIAGFYHPRSKELRLIRSGDADPQMKQMEKMWKQMFGTELEDVTLVHELHHAAQDQNFNLSTVPLDDETNDDRVSAIKGLIEGDASVVGWRWGLGEQFDQVFKMMNDGYKRGQLGGKAEKLPAYLRRTLAFPYGYGSEFVLAVLKNANEEWSSIDKCFDAPPLSTEQILHPEKYFGEKRDHPQEVDIKDVDALAGSGWKRLTTNVHGEFVIQILLGEYKVGRARDREKAAAGWDGDRFWTFENGKRVASVWLTTWDSDDDALEFYDLYVKVLETKYASAKKEAGDRRTEFAWDGGKAVVERRGSDVLIVDNHEALAGRLDDVFKAASKKEIAKVDRLKLTFACPKHPEEKSHKQEKCTQCDLDLKKIEGDPKKDY